MRVLFVGQAPSRDTDGLAPFTGRSGRKLASLLGMGHAEMLAAHDFVNLLDRWPGKQGKGDAFPIWEARAALPWQEIRAHDRVVLVGTCVARAFGVHAPFLEPFWIGAPVKVGVGQFIEQISSASAGRPSPTISAQIQGKMAKGLGAGCATFEHVPAMVVPHPSGVNRWWNDPANERAAEAALHAFIALPTGQRTVPAPCAFPAC